MARPAAPGRPAVRIAALGAILFAIGAVSTVIELRSHDFTAIYAAASLVLAGHGAAIVDPAAVLAPEHAAEPSRTVLLLWVQPPVVALWLTRMRAAPPATTEPTLSP